MEKTLKKTAVLLILTAALMLTGCNGSVRKYSFEGSNPEDSEIYVSPVAGLTDDFFRGVDISSYLSQIESGVEYRDFEGNQLDESGFFKLLAECGVNAVRVRIWNDPKDKDGNSYGGGHNDMDTAVAIGKLATEAGLQVLADFHCSDFWADPSKQKSPKEWAHYTFDNKNSALSEFLKTSMDRFYSEGVNVTMVQVGNEINNGFAGETVRERINSLLVTGTNAVREAAKSNGKTVSVALHYTNPESSNLLDYARDLKKAGVEYDVFAVSYYPFWHGTTERLTEQLKNIAENYGKKVMVAETSYLYTPDDGDGQGNSVSSDTAGVVLDYDISVQGQANEVRAVINAVKNVGDAGIGVFYWEPAWIPVRVYNPDSPNAADVLEQNKVSWETFGSGWASSYSKTYDPNDAGKYYGGSSWDNQALFDFEGNPLESLKIFRYVFSGTAKELEVVKVDNIRYESGIGAAVQMPSTVPALLNSGDTKDIAVTWNSEQVNKAESAGAGTYEIAGTADDGGVKYELVCILEIKKINYIKNYGFEDADMSMWEINGNGVGKEADNNKRSGEYSLKFWDNVPVSFTAEQKIIGLPAGKYELGAYLQGGSAGSNPIFELYITVNGERFAAQSGVTSWQNWDNPVVDGIDVPEGAEVTVGVKVEAAAEAWGAWDDFYLYEAE